MKMSVITVAYKNSKVVIDLLNSIAKYNDIGDELEVIVVDNSPEEDRIDKAIQVANYKDYIYIKADNRGFGAGNNTGAKIAKGEILAFLNPDIILIEPIFKKVIEKFEKDSNLVWLGGKLLSLNGDSNISFEWRYERQNHLFDACGRLLRKFDVFIGSIEHLSGADIFVRGSVFNEVGCFDETIFMYGEEDDLSYRILKKNQGYRIGFCKKIKIVHLEHASTSGERFSIIECLKGNKRYLEKSGFDYKKIFLNKYKLEHFKYLIDRWLRPKRAQQRKIMMECLKENYPEIFE